MARAYAAVTEPTRDVLSEREVIDFRTFKDAFLSWLESVGKEPKTATGYAPSTVKSTRTRVDRFYRYVWAETDGYTTAVSEALATDYMRSLVMSDEDYSNNYLSNEQKAIKRLFKWLNAERGEALEWNPDLTFPAPKQNPSDYLTRDEREQIRTAALEYGTVPAYGALSPTEREEWSGHLSQRFGIPKADVGADEFERANGWKIPSLVFVGLDTGLRPVEVERSKTTWIDTKNKVLRIPKEESSKNTDNWICGITDRTAEALERWLAERELYERYTGTDALWLTNENNPYGTNMLAYLMKRLFDVADIPQDGRTVSWYMLRHSVGTYMTREEGLAAAQSQLRHRSPSTTMKYDNTPPDALRDALDRMG